MIFHSITNVGVTLTGVTVVPWVGFNLYSLHAMQAVGLATLDYRDVLYNSWGGDFFPLIAMQDHIYMLLSLGGLQPYVTLVNNCFVVMALI